MKMRGKAVCLISGGIDSPVAAWLLARKGHGLVFAYFNNNPLSDESVTRRAMESVLKVMSHWPKETAKVYTVPHGDSLIEIITKCPRKLTCILCRRLMLKVAEKIATVEDAHAIVTGEILGEHASQTLHNIASENTATQIPILRPLIGMNKLDVERIAREIGTFDVSTKPASCCRATPKQPRTKSKVEEIISAESRLDNVSMIEQAFRTAKIEAINS